MILFISILVVNLIAFILMGYDKNLAKNHKRRVSEKTLLSFAFIGGTIGSGLGMLIFRHKTAKRSYLLKYWGIVILQLLVIFKFFYLDFKNF